MNRFATRLLAAAFATFVAGAPARAQLTVPRASPAPAPGLGTATPRAPAPAAGGTAPAATPERVAALRSSSIVELDRVAAVVNNEVVTTSELDARVRSVERQLRRQNIDAPPEDTLRRQVLERIILDRAQVQLAREQGLRVDEAQLDRALARIAEENRVPLPQLRERIERDGVSYAAFREEVRNELLISRLREREVDSRVQISEADVDAFLAEQAQDAAGGAEFNASQVLLRIPEGANAEQIERQRQRAEEVAGQARSGTDFARLAATYSDASDAMTGGALGWRTSERLPELFVDALAHMKPGEVGIVRSPNGFHVLKLNDRRDSAGSKLATTPVQQTHARHILIRPSELVSEAEALRRLRDIKERVERGGADFAELARQFSSDGTAARGGDLGWVYPGDTVPEFEQAMNALAPGRISEPVRTAFGLHLIQVIERRTDAASPDRVRQLARQALRERRAEEATQEWLRQLRDRTYVEYRTEERP